VNAAGSEGRDDDSGGNSRRNGHKGSWRSDII
jgi:hypothetical protein